MIANYLVKISFEHAKKKYVIHKRHDKSIIMVSNNNLNVLTNSNKISTQNLD